MATTFMVAAAGAVTAGAALFSGTLQPGAITSELLSLLLAGLTGIAIASASALDG